MWNYGSKRHEKALAFNQIKHPKRLKKCKYAINKANSWIKQQNPKDIEDLIPQILSQLKKKQ